MSSSIAITRLQKQSIPLSEATEIVQDVSTKFSQAAGTAVNKKLQTVLNKNKGFQIICNISKILTGEKENRFGYTRRFNQYMTYFNFAPITSSFIDLVYQWWPNFFFLGP
jgi:hypothetical protein